MYDITHIVDIRYIKFHQNLSEVLKEIHKYSFSLLRK
jgi:hypothetical protein